MLNAKTAEVHRLEVTSTLNQVHHKFEFCIIVALNGSPHVYVELKEVFARLNLETPEADTVNCSLAKGHSDL